MSKPPPKEMLEIRRELMAFADIGVYRYTMEGTVLHMDRTTLRILELEERFTDPSQVVGKNIADLFEYELAPGTLRKQVQETDEVRSYEYSFRTLSGTQKCCLHDSHMVHDHDSNQDAIQVITRDITSLKHVQIQLFETNRELARANAELQTLDEMKNNLLANVSHELRSPLVSVRGYADLIMSGMSGPVNPEQQRQLKIIVTNVGRLTAIVDDLLDAAQLDRSGPVLKPSPCDVNGLVEAAVLSVTPKSSQGSIQLDTDLAGSRPQVQCDPRLLSQVLVNLLTNAIKFSTPGGQIVTSTSATPDGGVCIGVTDNGIGIPAEEHERIFERFYQVDSSSTRLQTGLGLGLTLSRDIVERHGGTLTVQSALSESTTFRVTLPPAPPPTPPPGPPSGPPPGHPGGSAVR
jgi:signal transduction histidine kinase